MPSASQRLIIGISGASGVVYGVRLLEELRRHDQIETHLVLTKPAERTLAEETDYRPEHVKGLASVVHSPSDIGASIASGSFKTLGMVVIPCSIRSLSAIASAHGDNLLTRAADVVLKERRKLVLVVRETPFHRGHLKSMLEVTEAGAVVMPPVPAFYGRPKTIDDLIAQTLARVLDHFDIEHSLGVRWGGK
jgi:4-hydroxy-3-polyprenylbenzoate decarboxylase